jgi:hypothetical protein
MAHTSHNLIRYALDAVLGGALAVAIGLVFFFEPASEPAAPPIAPPLPVEPEQSPPPKPLRLAVVPQTAVFDDMGRLLDTLGEGYSYRLTDFDDLLDAERLARFDIVFLTCSGLPDNWLGEASGGQLRGGTLRAPNADTLARAKSVLRGFVGAGGTLYASDLHYGVIAECFPEFVDNSLRTRGTAQTVAADVVDPGLREQIGNAIDLSFDQEGWAAAALSGEGITTYLRGTFTAIDGTRKTTPLLVKFPHGQGNVVFTSFHNEKQNSEKERQLLKYLVFSAVTAGVDAEAGRQMAKGGFAATKKNLFSASRDAESVSQNYENKSVADLQFVLAFPEQGATLELAVTGPDGNTVRQQGSTTITIDVPSAAPGTWTYAIKAIKVPSANFPFTITVGQKK